MGCRGQVPPAARYSTSPSLTTSFVIFIFLFQVNSFLEVAGSSPPRERAKSVSFNRTRSPLPSSPSSSSSSSKTAGTLLPSKFWGSTSPEMAISPTPSTVKKRLHHPDHQSKWKSSRSVNLSDSTTILISQRSRTRHQPKIIRSYRLLSSCSNKYVRIAGKHVDAKANHTDMYALLRVETHGFESRLKIQGDRSQNYLCFNKNGKLAVRSSGSDGKCIFQEVLSADDHFTKFQSTFASHWFIAFSKQGRPAQGDFWTKRPQHIKCRDFIKIDSSTVPSSAADDDGDDDGDGLIEKKKKNFGRKPGPDSDFHRLGLNARLKPTKSRQV